MERVRATDLAQLQKSLRRWLQQPGDGECGLGTGEVRLLLDELGRLQQSADRLRRQNRRVRLRLQKAGLPPEPGDGEDAP